MNQILGNGALTDMQHIKKIKGMTLAEVIAGTAITAMAAVIVCTGVMTASNYIKHGTDIRNQSTKAAFKLEKEIAEVRKSNNFKTETKQYRFITYNGEFTGDVEVTDVSGSEGTTEYHYFVPVYSGE